MTRAFAAGGASVRPRDLRDLRDVREGGRWTARQWLKNTAILILVRSVLALVGRTPPSWVRAAGRALGRAAHACLRGERRRAVENLRRAFPDRSPAEHEALARAAFARLGAHLGDTASSLYSGYSGAPPGHVAFPEDERAKLAAIVAEGRGCLFISAHLGPWEQVAATLVAAGFPLTTVARTSYDPRLTPLYDRLRGGRGVDAIYRGDPGAGVRMVRTLRRGVLLGMPMDLRSRVPSIEVPFLGRPAQTAVGPARLALRTGARVVVGTLQPVAAGATGERHVALTVTTIAADDLGPGAHGDRVLTTRINDELSRRILALPEEWVWMHERFEPERIRHQS